MMEPFIKVYQFHFIKNQIQILINGHATVNDRDVLNALKHSSLDKVLNFYPELDTNQKKLLLELIKVEETTQAEKFLETLKPFVIPFKEVTEMTLKKLFPKVKKLKLPDLEKINYRDISYLGWNDYGSERKYIVVRQNDKFIGLTGRFQNNHKKGICALCNSFGKIGMFVSESKKSAHGTYIKRGNYICQDSQECNQNLITEEKLLNFVELLNN
jgi:hypothetical protein